MAGARAGVLAHEMQFVPHELRQRC